MNLVYIVDTALSEVPVNTVPLTDDTDFKTREESVAYNAAGMNLVWHFVTPAGAYSATAVTPTTGGDYDWAHQDDAMYTIEIPASGGASINNNAVGYGWFTGSATGVLPWRGPTMQFMTQAAYHQLFFAAALETGTAQSGASDKIQLATTASATADTYNGWMVEILSGTGAGQIRWIYDYETDRDALVDPAWATAPDNTSVYLLHKAPPARTIAFPPVEVENITSNGMGDIRTAVGLASANLDTQLTAIDDYLDTEVAAIKAKTDNLPSDPADASDIAALITAVDDFVDTEVAAIKAKTDNLPSDPADASDIAAAIATLQTYVDTEVAAILAAVDTEVAAIKAKTDQLTFSAAGFVDANMMEVNDNGGLVGTGDGGTPVGEAP